MSCTQIKAVLALETWDTRGYSLVTLGDDLFLLHGGSFLKVVQDYSELLSFLLSSQVAGQNHMQ